MLPVVGFDLAAALMALFMLARHGRAATALLRPARHGTGRTRALVPFLTCLVALVVLAAAARGLYLAASHAPGDPP